MWCVYIILNIGPGPSDIVLKSTTSTMNTFPPIGQLHLHWPGAAGGRSERPGQSTAPTVERLSTREIGGTHEGHWRRRRRFEKSNCRCLAGGLSRCDMLRNSEVEADELQMSSRWQSSRRWNNRKRSDGLKPYAENGWEVKVMVLYGAWLSVPTPYYYAFGPDMFKQGFRETTTTSPCYATSEVLKRFETCFELFWSANSCVRWAPTSLRWCWRSIVFRPGGLQVPYAL